MRPAMSVWPAPSSQTRAAATSLMCRQDIMRRAQSRTRSPRWTGRHMRLVAAALVWEDGAGQMLIAGRITPPRCPPPGCCDSHPCGSALREVSAGRPPGTHVYVSDARPVHPRWQTRPNLHRYRPPSHQRTPPVQQTRTGVALTSASLVLATMQQDRAGVYVRSAVPNATASSFTIHLSKAVTASTSVA